jgi:hypothetical protein
MESPDGKLLHRFAKAGEEPMKLHAAITSLAELVLIAAMGAIGAYAFLASSAYDAVSSFGQTHQVGFLPYLPLIIWGFITAFGVINIMGFNRGSGVFTWVAAIFCLPSLLAHNTVDWLGIAGSDFKLTTSLGFNSMLALGVLLITGYVILNYLRFFKASEHSMEDRRANPGDVESINGFSNQALFVTVCAAVAATALVAFLARGLETLVLNAVKAMPWNVVFIGLFCFLVLAFYLYWLTARRREENKTDNQDGENPNPTS